MENEVNQKNIKEKKENMFPDQNMQMQKKEIDPHTIKLLLVVLFAVIMTALAIGCVVYFQQKAKTAQISADYQQQIINLQKQQQNQINSNNELLNNNLEEQSDQVNYTEEQDTPPSYSEGLGLGEVIINWKKKAVETEEGCNEDAQCFWVGEIANDQPLYKGKRFFVEAYSQLGGGIKHYIIGKNGEGIDEKNYVEIDDESANEDKIVGISDIPEEITFPGTNFRLKKYYSPSYIFPDDDIKKQLFSVRNLGDLYLTKDGCIIAKLPDHTAVGYDFVIPFLNDESNVPNIIFNSGKENKDEYDYTVHSCGGYCTNLATNENIQLESLEVIGKTISGENVYRLRDSNNQMLIDLYNNKNTIAYYNDDYEAQGKNKYSYDEFIGMNPYLFWQDPLGRWVQLSNSKFESAAEMCKPVIYLYPHDKMNIGINVNVNGKLTYTNPEYKDGWRVEASPNGQIKNLDTGEYYDSLLWEGIGLNYPKQENGWVVKKENLNSFFNEKLVKLGLNDKEKNDFKEYWLSRLNEKTFYKISFISQKQFNEIASVEFSPIEPNNFIRVMMTAEGLDNYVEIPEQVLPNTPQRSGFTAVEWGGTLLK